MARSDYKPNSHKYKEEQREAVPEKKIQKVVSGTAKTKKKNKIRKFSDVFIAEDASSVGTYILSDVLVPATKKLVSDIVRDGIDMILYGGSGRKGPRSSGSKISYRSFYDDRGGDRHVSSNPSLRTRFDYDDIIFETRGEAEAARTQMDEVIELYGFVTVADMYDMCELTAPYTAQKYGWTSIRSAEIVRAREGGFIIKLPKAMPID